MGKLNAEEYAAALYKVQKQFDEAQFKKNVDTMNQAMEGLGDVVAGMKSKLEGMGETLFDQMTSGTFKVKEFVATFLREMARMVFQMMVWKPIIDSFMRGLSSFGGGLFSGAGAGAGVGVAAAATGGARASGGRVRAGESYNVGEFGTERFVPTVPGTIEPNVAAQQNIVVNIDMSGATQSSGDESQKNGELGRRIRAAILDVLRTEKRPGGMLSQGVV
jgi:hypothetical protein